MAIEEMENVIRTGSCTCGALKFEVRGPVVGIGQCHCSKCRKETGTGSSTSIPVSGNQFRWVSGQDQISDYDRCAVCGSLVPYHNPKRDIYSVPAGLLDDYTGIKVMDHIYVGSKASWDVIGDDAPQYDEDGPPLI